MRIKRVSDVLLEELSIAKDCWDLMAQDTMSIICDPRMGYKFTATANGEVLECDTLFDAVDFILDSTKVTDVQHKVKSITDYAFINVSRSHFDLEGLIEDYGFHDIKVGMKMNEHVVSVLVMDNKLTTGFMKRLYKKPYFEAGKIIFVK